MQNFCGKCGTKLSSDLKFCTNCGAPIQNNVDTPKEEVKKETIAEKQPLATQSRTSQNEAFDPKIKEISILILVLICALFVAGFIFNYPIQSRLNFDSEDKDDIAAFSKLYEEAYFSEYGFHPYSGLRAAKAMLEIKNSAKKYYPLINFELLWKIGLLVLIMIVFSYGAKELVKDRNKLKWTIISAILVPGLAYSYIVSNDSNGFIRRTNEELLLLFVFITLSIFFSTIAFYNRKEIKLWLYTSAIISLVFILSSGGFSKPEVLESYLNVQVSALFFYLFRYLYLASLIILPSMIFHHFLKSFVYESSLGEVNKTPMKIYSKGEYNDFKDRLLKRK